MSFTSQLAKTWENLPPSLLRQHLIQWRREPVLVRVEHPTKLHRAHALGYKAKPGFIVVRVRCIRGGRMREKLRSGRRPRTSRRKEIISLRYQTIAESRVNRHYPNCEVLNSYFLAKDGKHIWFEVILVDRSNPHILADPHIRWIAESQHRGRVFRGLTSSAKKSRGMLHKGEGAEKVR